MLLQFWPVIINLANNGSYIYPELERSGGLRRKSQTDAWNASIKKTGRQTGHFMRLCPGCFSWSHLYYSSRKFPFSGHSLSRLATGPELLRESIATSWPILSSMFNGIISGYREGRADAESLFRKCQIMGGHFLFLSVNARATNENHVHFYYWAAVWKLQSVGWNTFISY
jgi:hypothetical protein